MTFKFYCLISIHITGLQFVAKRLLGPWCIQLQDAAAKKRCIWHRYAQYSHSEEKTQLYQNTDAHVFQHSHSLPGSPNIWCVRHVIVSSTPSPTVVQITALFVWFKADVSPHALFQSCFIYFFANGESVSWRKRVLASFQVPEILFRA